MWGTSTINDIQHQAAVKAMAYGKKPQPAGSEIPFLGNYLPNGWTLVETRLVDSTGLGSSYEPAMTQSAFLRWAEQVQKQDPTAGFGVYEQGQFQVLVGYYSQQVGADVEYDVVRDGDIEFEICEGCGEYFETGETCECGYTDEQPEEPQEYKPGDIVSVPAGLLNELLRGRDDWYPWTPVRVRVAEYEVFAGKNLGVWVSNIDVLDSRMDMVQESDLEPDEVIPEDTFLLLTK